MSEVAADKTQPVPGASAAAPSAGHQPQAPQATHPQAHPLAQAHIQAAQAIKPPVVRNPLFRDPSKAPFRKLTVDLIRTYKHINTVSPAVFFFVDFTTHEPASLNASMYYSLSITPLIAGRLSVGLLRRQKSEEEGTSSHTQRRL